MKKFLAKKFLLISVLALFMSFMLSSCVSEEVRSHSDYVEQAISKLEDAKTPADVISIHSEFLKGLKDEKNTPESGVLNDSDQKELVRVYTTYIMEYRKKKLNADSIDENELAESRRVLYALIEEKAKKAESLKAFVEDMRNSSLLKY